MATAKPKPAVVAVTTPVRERVQSLLSRPYAKPAAFALVGAGVAAYLMRGRKPKRRTRSR